jgi:glucose/mannose-6-phosphate isomerase
MSYNHGKQWKAGCISMVDLDSPLVYQQIDTLGIFNHLKQFPEQCEWAWQEVLRLELPKECQGIDKVIILGMGGSSIGGEIARGLTLAESRVPVWVHRDYELPLFVDGNTLVIASSYSGNTEETLSAFTESLKTPAKKLVITTGGKLKELAEKDNIPIFIIDYKAPPRMAFPHSFIPLVGIFQRLGLLGDKSVDIKEALQVLKKLRDSFNETTPLISNPAKRLATELQGHIVAIYGGGILSAVAQRWKAQFNENGKTWAFFELFPELSHNAVVGYEFPLEVKERIFLVLLHSALLHPRSLLHYEATASLLVQKGIRHEFVEATGKSALAQVMSLVMLGDYLSCYIAILNRSDPAPIDSIDFVKSYLARFTKESS